MGEGCLKSVDSAKPRAHIMPVRHQLPPGLLDSLQAEFPDVRFEQRPDAFYEPTPLGDADAVVTWSLSPEEIDAAPNLRWVQWIGAGVDHAPLEALRRRGILLTNNRGIHANNIAEHIVGMMIAIARRFPRLVHAQDEQHWSLDDRDFTVREIAGSRILILGAGNIGIALANKAIGLEMNVEVIGRTPRPDFSLFASYGTMDTFDLRIAHADHVAICLPLTSETQGLFDAATIAKMKPGAVIYNIGRGPIIDTSALIAALESGHLGGAGLDVSDPEPLPTGHPLWTAPNVLITGHTSGRTPYFWDRGADVLRRNIRHYLAGEPLENLVDFELGY